MANGIQLAEGFGRAMTAGNDIMNFVSQNRATDVQQQAVDLDVRKQKWEEKQIRDKQLAYGVNAHLLQLQNSKGGEGSTMETVLKSNSSIFSSVANSMNEATEGGLLPDGAKATYDPTTNNVKVVDKKGNTQMVDGDQVTREMTLYLASIGAEDVFHLVENDFNGQPITPEQEGKVVEAFQSIKTQFGGGSAEETRKNVEDTRNGRTAIATFYGAGSTNGTQPPATAAAPIGTSSPSADAPKDGNRRIVSPPTPQVQGDGTFVGDATADTYNLINKLNTPVATRADGTVPTTLGGRAVVGAQKIADVATDIISLSPMGIGARGIVAGTKGIRKFGGEVIDELSRDDKPAEVPSKTDKRLSITLDNLPEQGDVKNKTIRAGAAGASVSELVDPNSIVVNPALPEAQWLRIIEKLPATPKGDAKRGAALYAKLVHLNRGHSAEALVAAREVATYGSVGGGEKYKVLMDRVKAEIDVAKTNAMAFSQGQRDAVSLYGDQVQLAGVKASQYANSIKRRTAGLPKPKDSYNVARDQAFTVNKSRAFTEAGGDADKAASIEAHYNAEWVKAQRPSVVGVSGVGAVDANGNIDYTTINLPGNVDVAGATRLAQNPSCTVY